MSVIRPELHTSLATQILNDIQFRRANYYYYLGRVEPWADDAFPPPEPSCAGACDIIARNNIIFMKRVNPIDVSVVVKNYTWETGLIFEQWDSSAIMTDTMFYCITDEFNVYKCLDNNKGSASTIKPTGTSVNPVVTADGYMWKYMYNVPVVKQLKFLSRGWFPTQRALTDAFYSKGALEQIEIINSGTGYTDSLQTTITINDSFSTSGGGTGAVLIASVSRTTGEITKVTIEDGGEDYDDPILTVVQFPVTGTGKYNDNPTAILKAIVEDGVIVNVTIEDPGQDYPADTDTTIVVQGDGTGAALTPVVYDGRIIDVIIENTGLNYTSARIIVVGNGENANIQAGLGISDFLSNQSVIEQSAVPGAIYNIKVTEAGDNYTPTTVVAIDGDGIGAAANVVLGAGGSIDKIVMTSYGSGYSNVTVTISDVNRISGEGFITATGVAILPPIGGHGYDAIKDLFGSTILIYTMIRDENEFALLQQDYRQYGLIENPLNLITNQRTSSATAIVTFDILLNSVTGISPDDVLTSNNVRYRVVSITDNTVKLQQLSMIYKTPGSQFENESEVAYTVVRIVSTPTVNKYSGNLMYITNNPPLSYASDQAFAIRTYIRF
jgi:hypothetical protein